MTKDLRILLVDHGDADAKLISQELQGAGFDVTAQRAETREGLVAALRDFNPHVVLSESGAGAVHARAAMDAVRAHTPTTPVIVVTDTIDGRAAVAAIRAGAEDIVVRSNIHRLPVAIQSAIAVRRPLQKLSPRQLQVLRLVAEGNTTPGIARRLKLSDKTIDTHRGEVMKRLGIHDVVGLVRYALRVGIVPADTTES